ncbi:MAG: acyltransferase family protein, partial [Vicinamibacterales bacterium]
MAAPPVPIVEQHGGYRPEIEGLRAVAVLAVLFFHVGLPMHGGYIGVDVFFVISGFLITQNIVRDQRAGIFTFARFYVRRIRRLFPALATTLLLTLAAGRLFLAPHDMAQLGEVTLLAVVSLSNVHFWREIGYFDSAADLKPLLHTWSLSVEEQFYLLWPAVVVAASRFGRSRALAAVVAAIGIASFAGAELFRTSDPGAVFYLMPFRMFELCSGAVLSALNPQRPRQQFAQLATAVGLSVVAYCAIRFDAHTAQQHYRALLPCVGTVLVIYGGSNSWSSPLLSNRLVLGVGAMSYSLYLVHWPVITFYRYVRHEEPASVDKLALVAGCLVLAAGMYWLVERRFRSGNRAGRSPVGARTAMFASAVAALAVSTLAAHAWQTAGWPARLPAELGAIPSETDLWTERNRHARVGSCFIYVPTET